MKTLAELRAHADERLFAGDYLPALHGYTQLVATQPVDLTARLRVADTLLALGEVQRAAVVYTALARHAAHAGYPLYALVAIKVLVTLEPQLESLLSGIAQLYAVGSPRLGRGTRMSLPDMSTATAELQLPGPDQRDALIDVAARVAADVSTAAVYPETLPPIPLFSELPAEAFARVLPALNLVRHRPGEPILKQGDPGDAFYVIARGSVRVTRTSPEGETTELATLHDGSIFGEMALVSASPRTADVTAVQDTDLLRFDRDALAAASTEVATIGKALDTFTRERLLSNLMAVAPLFRPLDRKQRFDLIRRFTAHEVGAGADIIQEGQPGRGLFAVLHGEVDVWKRDGDEKVLLATLHPGDVFGEISLLHDQPTSASVTAATRCTVLFLAREYFQRLVEAVPEIREYVEELGDERLMDTRILLSQGAPAAPDDDAVTLF